MLKIGQIWGKIANYPPNAQQRSAPLREGRSLLTFSKKLYETIFLVEQWVVTC